ncbi:PP2C-domain-containing protein [Macrolepiota fuliginosa MF-IS2]|uniref:protein-serine/threonine phosphatase n=1 Tax=Macrolepiota fuliginosa MF-IS2 TaxID=1400762 RepID=A0A9P6CB45_9AGAR|nr:PP2C-domain-containing protein [Macrolepiota fuliginosa MF-IS2]
MDKLTESGENSRFAYGVADMQGWRITMEDAHAAILDLDGEKDTNAFFAVYDGHGGSNVAKYAGQNVHKRLVLEESYKEKSYEAALKKAFLGVDEDLQANPAHTKDPSGCTAVAALVTDKNIYVANAGDSRSVIGIKGEVKPLSFDHKPTNDAERTRICDAGGYIEYGRVNGNLALSRALGDFEFKKNWSLGPEAQIITANPDVTCHEITEEDEFLVLACDGIWDCLSSQQVVDFVRYQVYEGKDLIEIGKSICDYCLAPDTASGAGIGCDNMTVLIVALLQGRTKEEWYTWMKDRVENQYGHATPSSLPQLYSQSRMMSFKARMEAMANRGSTRGFQDDSDHPLGFLAGTGLSGFARVLGSTGGISFHPGSGIMNDNGQLMFGQDDSDEEEEEPEVTTNASSFFSQTFSLGGRADSPDPTQQLKARLDEFERDLDEEGDATMSDVTEEKGEHGEASPSPKVLPNGDAKVAVPPVQQLSSQPDGDAASPAVKAEGFLDASEDPLKAC